MVVLYQNWHNNECCYNEAPLYPLILVDSKLNTGFSVEYSLNYIQAAAGTGNICIFKGKAIPYLSCIIGLFKNFLGVTCTGTNLNSKHVKAVCLKT